MPLDDEERGKERRGTTVIDGMGTAEGERALMDVKGRDVSEGR